MVRSFSDTFLNFFLHKLTQFIYYIKQITFTQTYIKSKLKLIQSNKLRTNFSGNFKKINSKSLNLRIRHYLRATVRCNQMEPEIWTPLHPQDRPS